MAAFPLVKLALVTVRGLIRPVAGVIEQKAKNNYKFRNRVCLPIARKFQKIQEKVDGKILGKPSEQAKPLDVEAAVNLGGDVLEEAIVLVVVLGITYWQVHDAHKKKKIREKEVQSQFEECKTRLSKLEVLIEQLQHNKGQS